MKSSLRLRHVIATIIFLGGIAYGLETHPDVYVPKKSSSQQSSVTGDASKALAMLTVKGRAPQTGYARTQFGNGWVVENGCDTRNIILRRDLVQVTMNGRCQVISGTLNDPYTGNSILFKRGAGTSDDVQIDHVVALSDAWQKGAQLLSYEMREQLANDPLELLAVDGRVNQQKSDGDAATWLPPDKAFRCQYVVRQVAVKKKYNLWITSAEKEAIARVLGACLDQSLPIK